MSSKPYLVASDDDLLLKFKALQKRADVADLLEIPLRQLTWNLYGKKERANYIEKLIPKKHGGTRRLCVPPTSLRIMQDKLLRVLTLVYKPRACVTGFTVKRSIVDNAIPHTQRRFVFTLDINDFFPSIHIGRVQGLFRSPPLLLGSQAATVLAQIVTHDDGHLPQGASTSPIVANMVCGPLDTALMALAREHRCAYSRYADDISFSTTQRQFPIEIGYIDQDGVCHVGQVLSDTIGRHGFSIRDGKTRLRSSLRRQSATGLVVNEFPNVPRALIRELRACIHTCKSKGLVAAATAHASKHAKSIGGDASKWILSVIAGHLNYIKMVRGRDDYVYCRLINEAVGIPGFTSPVAVPLQQRRGQPIRRRSRSAANWMLWASKYKHCVFRLKCQPGSGTSERFGTAFRVGASSVMTAGHNAKYAFQDDDARMKGVMFLDVPLPDCAQLEECKWKAVDGGGVDLAIGRVGFPEAWPTVFVPTQERVPLAGEEVAALGFPDVPFRTVDLVVHVGRIESVMTGYRDARFLSVSFSSGPALSGAPLIDANGYCLGVMVENTLFAGERWR